MKRLILTILLCMFSVISFDAKAQLQTMSVEESRGYQTVFKIPMGYGEIRYIKEAYILFGVTDNKYEKSMASIFLGTSKESAILTLEDLRKIVFRETKLTEPIVVKGFADSNTTILKNLGEIMFKTSGVSGYSHAFGMLRGSFDKAREAILSFPE